MLHDAHTKCVPPARADARGGGARQAWMYFSNTKLKSLRR